jgi:hypothetical protein
MVHEGTGTSATLTESEQVVVPPGPVTVAVKVVLLFKVKFLVDVPLIEIEPTLLFTLTLLAFEVLMLKLKFVACPLVTLEGVTEKLLQTGGLSSTLTVVLHVAD